MSYQSNVETKPSLDTIDAAAFLGVSPQTLHNWRSTKKPGSPPYLKLSDGPRGPVRYLLEDLRAYQNRRRIVPEGSNAA
jgi:hypothetical protein